MSEEKKFIIRQDQIDEIHSYLKNHSTIAVREILKQLDVYVDKSKEIRELKQQISNLQKQSPQINAVSNRIKDNLSEIKGNDASAFKSDGNDSFNSRDLIQDSCKEVKK